MNDTQYDLKCRSCFWYNPIKQKVMKRYSEDQNQSSNRLFWSSLLTSNYTLADCPMIQIYLKNFKRWILANCVESFLMTLHSQLISIFWNSYYFTPFDSLKSVKIDVNKFLQQYQRDRLFKQNCLVGNCYPNNLRWITVLISTCYRNKV
jgi:hypothetical protein